MVRACRSEIESGRRYRQEEGDEGLKRSKMYIQVLSAGQAHGENVYEMARTDY